MQARGKQKVVVVGAGIAGSLIVSGLRDCGDIKLTCLERVDRTDHAEAGTGLNIGPNALKCMAMHLPIEAATIIGNSLPWRRWRVSLTDGRLLMDLSLNTVADNPGIRIRWADLYALLRGPIRGSIQYQVDLTGCGTSGQGLFVSWTDRASGQARRIDGIDLLIGADGRYSVVREAVVGGPEVPDFLDVCLFRLLVLAGPDCPIDDYGQWFNGPNRLLAFRVPGDFVYIAGSFPIPPGAAVPEAMKQAAALRTAYQPATGSPSREAAYLIDAVTEHADRIHWARLQEGGVNYGQVPGVLLTGDAAHPMVPTLGQGATQACEDACVVVDEIRAALAAGRPLGTVPGRVEARRAERVRFVVDFSREATDTMLADADPVAGTLKKNGPAFMDKLARLYRDVPTPLSAAS